MILKLLCKLLSQLEDRLLGLAIAHLLLLLRTELKVLCGKMILRMILIPSETNRQHQQMPILVNPHILLDLLDWSVDAGFYLLMAASILGVWISAAATLICHRHTIFNIGCFFGSRGTAANEVCKCFVDVENVYRPLRQRIHQRSAGIMRHCGHCEPARPYK